mgnify:CR=1 FL=1
MSRQGEKVSPNELWDGILEIAPNTDKEKNETLQNIRTWITDLTFRRSPLVEHNGVRASGSKYSTSEHFDLSVSFAEKTQRAEDDKLEVEQKDNDEPESDQLILNPKNEAIISTRDLSLVAVKLGTIGPALVDYEFPAFDKEIIDSLHVLVKEMFVEAPLPDHNDAVAEREQAICTMTSLINDDDLLLEYIDNANEESPQFRLMEYFMELEGTEDKNLMQQLITSKSEQIPSLVKGSVVGVSSRLLDQNGMQIWPLPEEPRAITISQVKTSTVEDEVSEESPTPDDDSTEMFVRPNGESVVDQRNQSKTSRREEFDKIVTELESTISVLFGQYGLTPELGTLTSNQLSSVQSISANYLSLALSSNLLSSNERDPSKRYTVDDILRIVAYKHTRGTYFDISAKKTSGAKAIFRALEEVKIKAAQSQKRQPNQTLKI